MKKILSTNYPIITTYTHHAHLLTILSNEPKAKSWIFSNYIQIYMSKYINKWADFYFPMSYEVKTFELCKWLEVQKNSEEFVDRNYGDIVKYVINLIDSNFYVHMMINYKYVSKSKWSKGNKDVGHDILVYGYDDVLKILYCADFLFEPKYAFSDCTFDEFYAAYNNSAVKTQISYLSHNIFSYKIKNECDYEYHLNNIVYWFKQYVNSEVPEYWKGYNYCNKEMNTWGISCYDILIQNIINTNIDYLDVRTFYLLKDHKKIMIERLKFIDNESLSMQIFIEAYRKMYSMHTEIVNLVIKYNISQNRGIINKITCRLIEVRETEFETLNKLIASLESFMIIEL